MYIFLKNIFHLLSTSQINKKRHENSITIDILYYDFNNIDSSLKVLMILLLNVSHVAGKSGSKRTSYFKILQTGDKYILNLHYATCVRPVYYS